MTAEADQLVLDFLGRVADLAQGQMSPQSRARLIERLRQDIMKRAAERNAEKPGDVRQILLGLGTAEALVTVEANKDPLYRARQAERLRSGFGAASVFSPEVDPEVAAMVTPDTLNNPLSDRFGARDTSGALLPGPELPLDPDPFGAGAGEWEGSGDTLVMPAVSSGGPQVPMEGGGSGGSRGSAPAAPYYSPAGNGPWVRRFGHAAAQNHTQAFIAIAVLALGAAVNAVSSGSPYGIGGVLIGYLLGMTSYSYTLGEKRFALFGVPTAAILFYAFGLFLARGRSTGHDQAVDASQTWQTTKDWLDTVPTMLGLLAALYLAWRLAKSVAKNS